MTRLIVLRYDQQPTLAYVALRSPRRSGDRLAHACPMIWTNVSSAAHPRLSGEPLDVVSARRTAKPRLPDRLAPVWAASCADSAARCARRHEGTASLSTDSGYGSTNDSATAAHFFRSTSDDAIETWMRFPRYRLLRQCYSTGDRCGRPHGELCFGTDPVRRCSRRAIARVERPRAEARRASRSRSHPDIRRRRRAPAIPDPGRRFRSYPDHLEPMVVSA